MSQAEEKSTAATATPKDATAAESSKTAPAKPRQKESMRDSIEAILFAFVLAFLFRTFEAEAFVIPTGSMAPTLYGRHKDSECTQCGSRIVVGASHEVNPRTGLLSPHSRLHSAICPNCGFNNTQLFNDLAFNGDRILVNKYPYEFGEPDRWDVFVFKFPEEPETNYIKRLVGLPGDVIRIRNGNLYQLNDGTEKILRKSPKKQNLLQIPVYQHDHAPKQLLEAGWPERFAPEDAAAGWKADSEARTFSIDNPVGDSPAWLRYRHYFPMPSDWNALAKGTRLQPRPRLIGDYCGYNAALQQLPGGARVDEIVDFGPFWVPDLTIDFDVKVASVKEQGELVVELREGTAWYRCRLQAHSGKAVLEEINTQMNFRVRELGTAQTSFKGAGNYHITFANVDDRLCLWVDGSLADFGDGANLDIAGTEVPFPTTDDLSPVGIGVQGLAATVSHLELKRDIYYRTAYPERDRRNDDLTHLQAQLARLMTDPEQWADLYQKYADNLAQRTITVEPDHFLALGDNSPQSKDSRLWEEDIDTVPRKYLVGKAFWIYWPHGVPFMNDGKGFSVLSNYEQDHTGRQTKLNDYPRYTIPFYPQVTRMKRIR
ncbi:signal peptidase I [Planctomicrobium sp. SH664]|uniref:signal peptidase I n=1 Tax=Planctomicrobium sp. SH664 TaxID=3448125 RepID=UPI003F5AE416